jgi:hypothetical protein
MNRADPRPSTKVDPREPRQRQEDIARNIALLSAIVSPPVAAALSIILVLKGAPFYGYSVVGLWLMFESRMLLFVFRRASD